MYLCTVRDSKKHKNEENVNIARIHFGLGAVERIVKRLGVLSRDLRTKIQVVICWLAQKGENFLASNNWCGQIHRLSLQLAQPVEVVHNDSNSNKICVSKRPL